MLNLLTPFGITQIAIVTALAVAVIALVALNIYLIVRARRKKQAGHGEPVIVYVSVPAPAAEPEAAKDPQPEVIEAQPEVIEEQAVEEPAVVIKADITPEEEELLSRLKLDRSYTAKLVQTEEETKQLYAELKRELLSYVGVHSRISWRRETFSKSREPLARFGVRGKTLCLYLALQPADFSESKYKAEDASGHSSFADTPLMYRIKNPLRMRYAKELIGILMTGRGIERAEYAGEDPMTGLEYRSTPVLIDEGLIRVPAGMELPVFTEPVQEIAATEEPQPVEEQTGVEEPAVVIKADITPEEEELLSRLKLDRSYTAKLVQTEEETKQLYAELKRELLSYAGVHSRISWRRETFNKSREPLARFGVRGKTLCLYLALQPADFSESKYKAEDASGHSSFVDTPLMYRIKNPLRMRYAKELIGILMTGRGIERAEYAGEDPMTGLEYRSTPVLIDEGLIRVPAGMELPVFIEPVQEIAATEDPQPEVIEAQPVEEQAVAEEPAVIVKADITPEEEELLSRLKLDRSYTAKLVQTEEETKQLYAELKRELLSYVGVHSRISWRRETFNKSREPLARFGVRGKTLCLYLALQPADFAESKYKAEDASEHSSFADTPLMYRIKNPLRMRYAKELIGILMTGRGIERAEYAGEDPMTGLEYRSTPVLIDEGLIRVPACMELPVFTEPVQEAAVTEEPQPEVIEAQPVEEQAVAEELTEEQAEETPTEPKEEPTAELVDEQQEETNGQTEETIALSAEEPPIIAEPQYIEEEVQPVVEEAQPEVIEAQPIIEEPQPEDIEVQPVVEEPQSEAVEEAQPVEEQTGVEEPAEEQAEEKPTEPKEEPTAELVDEQQEETAEREIPVVGVMFRRRAKKVYWFDPDGKEWQRDEVAIYTTPEGVRTEVVVVEVTRRAEGLLHLPLKALEKLEG